MTGAHVRLLLTLIVYLLQLSVISEARATSIELADPELSEQAKLLGYAREKYINEDWNAALEFCGQVIEADTYTDKTIEAYALRASNFKANKKTAEARDAALDAIYRGQITSGDAKYAKHCLENTGFLDCEIDGRRLNSSDFRTVCDTIDKLAAFEYRPPELTLQKLCESPSVKIEGFVWGAESRPLWTRHHWISAGVSKFDTFVLKLNPEQCTITPKEMLQTYGKRMKELHRNYLGDSTFPRQFEIETPNCQTILNFKRGATVYLDSIQFYWYKSRKSDAVLK